MARDYLSQRRSILIPPKSCLKRDKKIFEYVLYVYSYDLILLFATDYRRLENIRQLFRYSIFPLPLLKIWNNHCIVKLFDEHMHLASQLDILEHSLTH